MNLSKIREEIAKYYPEQKNKFRLFIENETLIIRYPNTIWLNKTLNLEVAKLSFEEGIKYCDWQEI